MNNVKQVVNEKVWVRCSDCGNVLTFYINKLDHQYVSDAAEGCGWVCLRGTYYCPTCKENH